MKEITVLVDKSGSMNVLGKNAITNDLVKFLHLYPEMNSCDEKLTFIQQDWDGSNEELNSICQNLKYFVILTDGYTCNDNCESTLQAFSLDEDKHFAIVLVGADAFFRQINTEKKISVFRAADINVVADNFSRK